jgi:hypothetical protein
LSGYFGNRKGLFLRESWNLEGIAKVLLSHDTVASTEKVALDVHQGQFVGAGHGSSPFKAAT